MMAADIRLPNITAATEAGQLAQIRSYLYQLAEQMQWAIGSIDRQAAAPAAAASAASSPGKSDPESDFNAIKALIIKSADIVNAYYETINKKLSGLYVAQSDFGTYVEETAQRIEASSDQIRQNFDNIQKILSDVHVINEIIVNAYIKSGHIDDAEDGSPIYGLEIGQKNTVDGVETFNRFARFTSGKLSFYDQNETEVAYISDYRLYITDAEIKSSLTIGGYKIETSNGLTFRWVGG